MFVTFPSKMTVTPRAPNVSPPFISTTPGSSFKASYTLSIGFCAIMRGRSYSSLPGNALTTGRSPSTITSGKA